MTRHLETAKSSKRKEPVIVGSCLCVAVMIVVMLLPLSAYAQQALPGGYEHIIEVARFDNWGKHYLTITDPAVVSFSHDKKNWTIEYLTYEYVGEAKNNEENQFGRRDLIIEVDGVSAKDWTPEQFYRKVDGRKDVITLKIRTRDYSKGFWDYVTQIRPRFDINKDLVVFGDDVSSKSNPTYGQKRAQQYFSYEERNDPDYDFFNCMFFDYKLTSDDPLLDKELIKEMGMLERNESKPDVYLNVKTSASTEKYLVEVGSTSRSKSFAGSNNTSYAKSVTTNRNQINTRIDTYLEITAFDAKKMKEGETENLPVIWKGIAKRSTPNGNYETTKELKAYASWMTMPVYDKQVNIDGLLYAPTGITVGSDPFVIESVAPGSRAEMLGLQRGDKLIDAEVLSGWSKDSKKTFKTSLKNNGWGVFNRVFYPNLQLKSWTYRLKVATQSGKKTLMLEPVSINFKRYYIKP